MKKWPVISLGPQILLPCWTYCGHCKALGRASQGLVCLGYLPLHFQCLVLSCHSSDPSWFDIPAKRPGQWLMASKGPEWHVGKSTLFLTLGFSGRFLRAFGLQAAAPPSKGMGSGR